MQRPRRRLRVSAVKWDTRWFMKVHSPDITHKTDAGGVRLDLRCDADVCEAYRQIISSARRYKPDARIEEVTIQPYFSNPDFEAKRDPGSGDNELVIHFGGNRPCC